MRVIFAGTPETAVPVLESLQRAGHEIVGVITRADAPQGRKKTLTPSAVAQYAETAGLEIYKTNRLDEEATAWAAAKQPDVGVVVAYGDLLEAELLETPKHGWVNLHFSKLPNWRGAAPVQRALMAGETELYVTVFRLVTALDAGAILTSDSLTVKPGTTAGEALEKLAQLGTKTVSDALALLAADPAAGTPQQGEATYAHKLTRTDGKLDPALPAAEILAHWAGVTPEPGAYLEIAGALIKLHAIEPLPGESGEANGVAEGSGSEGAGVEGSGPEGSRTGGAGSEGASVEGLTPGTITLTKQGVIWQTTNGALLLKTVQPAGKPRMAAAAWLRGRGGQVTL